MSGLFTCLFLACRMSPGSLEVHNNRYWTRTHWFLMIWSIKIQPLRSVRSGKGLGIHTVSLNVSLVNWEHKQHSESLLSPKIFVRWTNPHASLWIGLLSCQMTKVLRVLSHLQGCWKMTESQWESTMWMSCQEVLWGQESSLRGTLSLEGLYISNHSCWDYFSAAQNCSLHS